MKDKEKQEENQVIRRGKKGRTVILNKRHTPNAAKWVMWLEENCIGSAGPRPSVVGMRNIYCGKESLLVKAGSYLYYLKRFDDFKPLPWEL